MPPASAAASDWSIVPSPNASDVQTYNFLRDVTCVSASDCWAVGNYQNGGVDQTLITRWDGISWTVVASPNTSATQRNLLEAVTCVSASDCWAVGFYQPGGFGTLYQTLILRWNGTSWTIVPSPNTSASHYNWLYDVTCVSASDCWAVGISSPGTGGQTLIQRWDGTSWTIVTSPNTSASQYNILNGVTCVSASDCWAVGSYNTGSASQTLTMRWNGISWSIVTSPNTSATQNNYLSGVTCVSASDCWAVGYYHSGGIGPSQTLIQRWDGTLWAIVASPSTPDAINALLGVTCVSASDCWAVGYYIAGAATQTLIERWDGSSWSIVASPNTSATQSNPLYGVTCVSASDCWVVGGYNSGTGGGGGGGTSQTLIERWDGTSWAIVTSANALATQTTNVLNSVTCVSASDCWAVGYYDNGNVVQTLIERWDGTSWAIVASPNTSATQFNVLNSVTCVSASDCWAVGYYGGVGIANQTLILGWDGASWVIVASPNTSAMQANVLNDVTCVSASDCWAVGSTTTRIGRSTSQTLIERWDGTSWTIVISPNALATEHVLTGVTCASASDCWAVGSYLPGNVNQTLIARWNGTLWLIVTSPNTSASQHNYLNGITCASASDCWAVGSYLSGNVYQTLIERWNGMSWAIVPSANTSAAQSNLLRDVTCGSASDCWAVGYYFNGSAWQTLIERWDASSWAIVSSPNTSTTLSNFLGGVTCVSASECLAVGYYEVTNNIIIENTRQTLVLRYTANAPSPTSAVSRKAHEAAGNFDILLPLTGEPGIECRSGGANSDHQIVLTFPTAVTFNTAAVTSGIGTVSNSSGNGTTEVTVNLTGVSNAQTITITLSNVSDGTNTGDVSVPMGVLLGDTNGNGAVNASDISQTKSQSGQTATTLNFRTDVNVNGVINASDISTVKSRSGTALP